MNKNKCSICGRPTGFDENWTEEDALKEYQENFPNDPNMELPVDHLCDDCYNKFYGYLINLTPKEREKIDREAKQGVDKI